MTIQGRNEAAERLRQLFLALPMIRPKLYQATPDGPESIAPVDPFTYRQTLDEALTAERKATVERIRAALVEAVETREFGKGPLPPSQMLAILDAEAQR